MIVTPMFKLRATRTLRSDGHVIPVGREFNATGRDAFQLVRAQAAVLVNGADLPLLAQHAPRDGDALDARPRLHLR